MKKLFPFLTIACFFWTSMNLYAQEDYELLDFPQPGMVQGSVYFGSPLLGGGGGDISFGYDSDTLLCGKTYNKFWRIGQGNNEFYMRYDNGKIYYLLDCDDEFLMFDFSLEKGEVFETIAENDFISKTLVVDSIAIITIPNGEKRKWMQLESEEGFSEIWIEGVGNIFYGIFKGFDIDGGYSRLICQKDSSGLVFEAFDIEELEQDCEALTCPPVRVDFSFQTMGNSIQLASQSQNEDAYEWTYGDGSPVDNNENPIHDFGIAGCYDICLKATSQCGRKDSLCQQVGVGFSEEWERIESGFDFNSFELGIRDAHFIDSDIVWMVNMTDIFKSVDGGENWNSVPHPNSEVGLRQFQSIHFYNDQFGIISALTTGITEDDIPILNNVLITKNGGNTWESVYTDEGSYFTDAVWVNEEVAYVTGFSLWEISPENTTYLLMTNDGGDTWEHRQVSEGFEGGDIFAQNEFVVFVTGGNRLLDLGELAATYDGGENWVVLLNATDPLVHVFAIENDVWATTSMGEVYKSADLGVSWTSIGHIGESPNDIYFTDSMQGWAVGNEGKMYATNDGGFTWELEYCNNSPLQNIHFPSMESIYIVTDEGILLTNSTITSISENPITVKQPLHAFPNPFTDYTSLQLITKHSKITCQVFDAYGRLVKTIEGSNVESLKVDREGLADGLYFYKVFGGNELFGSGKLMVVD